MARKYEFRPNVFGLSMEMCEEKLLIASFTDVEGRMPNEIWPHDFRHHFYTSGSGVSIAYVRSLNAVRIRCGYEEIEFLETQPSSYCRLNDRPLKSQKRQTWLKQYRDLDTADRVQWFHEAKDEAQRLPPCSETYDRRISDRHRFNGAVLSEREIKIRAMAVAGQALAPRLEAKAKAMKQLELLQSVPDADEVVASIVASLDPDMALEIANEFEEAKLRTMLVRRSLEY